MKRDQRGFALAFTADLDIGQSSFCSFYDLRPRKSALGHRDPAASDAEAYLMNIGPLLGFHLQHEPHEFSKAFRVSSILIWESILSIPYCEHYARSFHLKRRVSIRHCEQCTAQTPDVDFLIELRTNGRVEELGRSEGHTAVL